MNKRLFAIIVGLVALFLPDLAHSQNLKVAPLTNKDRKEGVREKYQLTNQYDGIITLLLFNSGKYYYRVEMTSNDDFSRGRWSKKNGSLYLSSEVTKSEIPIQVKYMPPSGVHSKLKSPFLIPVNLKGEKFPDSKVYIDNDSSFCFPYFDTCVAPHNSIDSIKVQLGEGFATKWVKVDSICNNKVLIVVQLNYLLSSYLPFNNRCYKIFGSELRLIKE